MQILSHLRRIETLVKPVTEQLGNQDILLCIQYIGIKFLSLLCRARGFAVLCTRLGVIMWLAALPHIRRITQYFTALNPGVHAPCCVMRVLSDILFQNNAILSALNTCFGLYPFLISLLSSAGYPTSATWSASAASPERCMLSKKTAS